MDIEVTTLGRTYAYSETPFPGMEGTDTERLYYTVGFGRQPKVISAGHAPVFIGGGTTDRFCLDPGATACVRKTQEGTPTQPGVLKILVPSGRPPWPLPAMKPASVFK